MKILVITKKNPRQVPLRGEFRPKRRRNRLQNLPTIKVQRYLTCTLSSSQNRQRFALNILIVQRMKIIKLSYLNNNLTFTSHNYTFQTLMRFSFKSLEALNQSTCFIGCSPNPFCGKFLSSIFFCYGTG